ncbi:MAG: DinB family protein [Synergistaceae bacterium]|nr:DinB family protein [Synergistaceae bacterium]
MRKVTEALKGSFDMGWNFLTQVIDVCPDAVWTKKAGGYVFWQQLYHCFSAVDYFLLPKDGAGEPGPWGADVSGFKAEPTVTPGKEELKAYAAKMKAKVDTWVASLDDDALSQNHEGLSSRWGAPTSNAATLAILSGHSMYHVGSCDAILRDNGEKGVM